jgi:hypothetical protein
VNRFRRECTSVFRGAGIGQQSNENVAPGQRRSQRFGGKQMAAGAACGDKDERRIGPGLHFPSLASTRLLANQAAKLQAGLPA